MLSYANIEFAYEQHRDLLPEEDQPRRKDYSRNRTSRPRRRGQRRAVLGFAGRRQRRGGI